MLFVGDLLIRVRKTKRDASICVNDVAKLYPVRLFHFLPGALQICCIHSLKYAVGMQCALFRCDAITELRSVPVGMRELLPQ